MKQFVSLPSMPINSCTLSPFHTSRWPDYDRVGGLALFNIYSMMTILDYTKSKIDAVFRFSYCMPKYTLLLFRHQVMARLVVPQLTMIPMGMMRKAFSHAGIALIREAKE
jgi:hypothetical protein